MIRIQVNNEMFAYDMYHIIKAFCPGKTIEQTVHESSEYTVHIKLEEQTLHIHNDELLKFLDRKSKKTNIIL